MKQEGFLLGRTWSAPQGPGGAALGLAQFNCLADSLHDAFPRVDKAVLQWTHRRPLLFAEIGRYVDRGLVVCCEEVEHFEQFKEALGASAHCFFAGKGDRDGCALFVPKARFAMVGEPEKVVLVPKASQVALIARLRDNGSGRIVLVACTHFKAKHGFEELRQRQAKALCEAIGHRKQPGDVVLVGGDFNDEPTSLACEEMRKHGYRSAYAALKLESYSTSKIRESVSERCIDYIWFDPGALTPLAVLEIPTAESLGPTKLPLAGFPSDHLSIATEFSFK